MAQALPFLPGYNIQIKPKASHHKSHLFDVQNGIRCDTMRATDLVEQRSFPDTGLAVQQYDFDNTQDIKYRTVNEPLNNTSSMPAWLAYDRKVLRFYAYFKEAVFSSPTENFRYRKCVLYYYLEDDSVHIAEPKIENSGIQQGVFIKRHRIPKANHEYINLNDLKVGASLNLYGRIFYLCDCDDFTRAFYAESGAPQDPPQEVPVDAFTKKHTKEVGTFKKLMHPMKEHMEAQLGKKMGVDIAATQKFLKNDGCVLRFYCVWHDDSMYGESRPYLVHYFLADDTVEVLEVKQANSGRDSFPALLKRSKLPKKYEDVAPNVAQIGTNASSKAQYYTAADFAMGGIINVFGRELLICKCDTYTRDFYKQNFQMTDADFPEVENESATMPEPARIEAPPYNGFGTEEDSLGSFLYLMPKVPKIDYKKQFENDGLNLRFLGKFPNPNPEDKNRRFIITYFMNNDTIGIFEKFQRNSGFIGGKYLERQRIKNPNTNEYYVPADLMPGTTVRINFFDFKIIEADKFTEKFMEKNPAMFPQKAAAEPAAEPDHPEVAF